MKTTTSFFSNLSNVEKVLVAILGLLIGCLLCIIPLRSVSNSWSEFRLTDTPPTLAQRTSPNYGQMLFDNGFSFVMTDNAGNPSYISPCGTTAVVHSDYVGFIAPRSGTDCATENLGAIISVMYPLSVFDFVVTAMSSLNEFDQTITGTASGYTVTVTITGSNHELIVIIRDPR